MNNSQYFKIKFDANYENMQNIQKNKSTSIQTNQLNNINLSLDYKQFIKNIQAHKDESLNQAHQQKQKHNDDPHKQINSITDSKEFFKIYYNIGSQNPINSINHQFNSQDIERNSVPSVKNKRRANEKDFQASKSIQQLKYQLQMQRRNEIQLINNAHPFQATFQKGQLPQGNSLKNGSNLSQPQIKLNIRSQLIRRSRKYQISTNNAHKKYINCLKNLFYQALSQQKIAQFQNKYIKLKSSRVFFFIILVYVKYRFSQELALAVKYGFQKQMGARIQQYEQQIYRCSDFMLKNYRYQEIHEIQIALKAIDQFYKNNTNQAVQFLYRKDKHIIVKQNHFRTSLNYIKDLQIQFSQIKQSKITKPYIKDHYHRKYNPQKQYIKDQYSVVKTFNQQRQKMEKSQKELNNQKEPNIILKNMTNQASGIQRQQNQQRQKINRSSIQNQQEKTQFQLFNILNKNNQIRNQSLSQTYKKPCQLPQYNLQNDSFIQSNQLEDQFQQQSIQQQQSLSVQNISIGQKQQPIINDNAKSNFKIYQNPQNAELLNQYPHALNTSNQQEQSEENQKIMRNRHQSSIDQQQQSSNNLHRNLNINHHYNAQQVNNFKDQRIQTMKQFNQNLSKEFVDQMIFPPIPPYFYTQHFDQKYGPLLRKLIYIKKWKQLNRQALNNRSAAYQNNREMMARMAQHNKYVEIPQALNNSFFKKKHFQ